MDLNNNSNDISNEEEINRNSNTNNIKIPSNNVYDSLNLFKFGSEEINDMNPKDSINTLSIIENNDFNNKNTNDNNITQRNINNIIKIKSNEINFRNEINIPNIQLNRMNSDNSNKNNLGLMQNNLIQNLQRKNFIYHINGDLFSADNDQNSSYYNNIIISDLQIDSDIQINNSINDMTLNNINNNYSIDTNIINNYNNN